MTRKTEVSLLGSILSLFSILWVYFYTSDIKLVKFLLGVFLIGVGFQVLAWVIRIQTNQDE